MTINQRNDALTNDQKNAIKRTLNQYVKKFNGDFSFEQTKILNTEIEKISKDSRIPVVELSIYLKAVSKHLDLDKYRVFDQKVEYKLLAALRYFIETDDVIPDWEMDGYDDDIYCLNIAIKELSKDRQKKIELSVEAIKAKQGFIDGT
jgi:uncharacterized membrane protein YkvA (DUF1232 family)